MRNIPEISMDTKNNGGIHLWIKGNYVSRIGDNYSISVHLTRMQLLALIFELMRRFLGEERK